MKKPLLLILSICGFLNTLAQDVRTSVSDDKSQITMNIDINNWDLIKEDLAKESTPAPLRIAKVFPLEINTSSAGVWSQSQDDESIWSLTIKVPNSHGIIVSFSDFYLPKGSKLYVYNEERDYGATVYTHELNENGGKYMAETSWGSEIVLEYVAPKGLKEKPRLQTTEIGYKYREIYDQLPTTGNTLRLNEHQNRCIPNINCPEGEEWQSQKKGVLRLITKLGSTLYMCSGSLVNNTSKDKKPYVLTAAHCLNIEGTEVNPEHTDFFFDYEHPDCENAIASPAPKILSGATTLSVSPINGGSDGALLLLDQNIPSGWDVYFNGWDLSNIGNNNQSGAVIQHPHGDVKKIAIFSRPVSNSTWIEYGSGSASSEIKNQGASNAHWLVRYSKGVTQGGSSGSPLFNQKGMIIGTLTGGATSCTSLNERDYYGKMWYHWNQYSDASQHMKKYLDPTNSGVTELKGMNQKGETQPPHPEPEPENNLMLAMEGTELAIRSSFKAKKIRIIGQSGQEVYQKEDRDWAVERIPTASWSGGIYIVTIWGEDGKKYTQKIVK